MVSDIKNAQEKVKKLTSISEAKKQYDEELYYKYVKDKSIDVGYTFFNNITLEQAIFLKNEFNIFEPQGYMDSIHNNQRNVYQKDLKKYVETHLYRSRFYKPLLWREWKTQLLLTPFPMPN